MSKCKIWGFILVAILFAVNVYAYESGKAACEDGKCYEDFEFPEGFEMPATIEEAVIKTGGTYGEFSNADGYDAFVDQMLDNGMHEDQGKGSARDPYYVAGGIKTSLTLDPEYPIKTIKFQAKMNEIVNVRVSSKYFIPKFDGMACYRKIGGYITVRDDIFGEPVRERGTNITVMQFKAPFTGDYLFDIVSVDTRTGLFDILVSLPHKKIDMERSYDMLSDDIPLE